MTIPRLELTAAAIGIRLTNNVLKSIEFENVQTWYWTDSTTVLSWIQKPSNVWNRVKEIRSRNTCRRLFESRSGQTRMECNAMAIGLSLKEK